MALDRNEWKGFLDEYKIQRTIEEPLMMMGSFKDDSLTPENVPKLPKVHNCMLQRLYAGLYRIPSQVDYTVARLNILTR